MNKCFFPFSCIEFYFRFCPFINYYVSRVFFFFFSFFELFVSPLPSVQFSSVAQSCRTLCDPMNHSTPGLCLSRGQRYKYSIIYNSGFRMNQPGLEPISALCVCVCVCVYGDLRVGYLILCPSFLNCKMRIRKVY